MSVAAVSAPDDGVRVVVDGRRYAGVAVDLRSESLSGAAVLGALDGETDRLRVDAPDPGPLHRTLGVVDGARGVDRPVLAAVARCRGHVPPQAARIDRLRERLAECDPPAVDRRTARKRLADRRDEAERLRERVAELRGRVQACREGNADGDPPTDDLAAATERLLEADTERIAARQRLDELRSAAERARDRREHRLELQDRIDNCEREARRTLAGRALPAVGVAVAALPGAATTANREPSRDGAAGELAAYRCGRPSAPVVLAANPLADPESAARWLGAPVLRI